MHADIYIFLICVKANIQSNLVLKPTFTFVSTDFLVSSFKKAPLFSTMCNWSQQKKRTWHVKYHLYLQAIPCFSNVLNSKV